MNEHKCPECEGRLLYDDFEDMYSCAKCLIFFYPEQIGAVSNDLAGYNLINFSGVVH